MSPMACPWVKFAAINFALALGLAWIVQDWPDALAIMLITAALSLAQVLYWAWVCNGFRR